MKVMYDFYKLVYYNKWKKKMNKLAFTPSLKQKSATSKEATLFLKFNNTLTLPVIHSYTHSLKSFEYQALPPETH